MSKPRYAPPSVAPARFPGALAREQDRVDIAPADWDALEFEEQRSLLTLGFGGLRLQVAGEPGALSAALAEHWSSFRETDTVDPQRTAIELSLREVERLPFPSPIAFGAWARRGDSRLVKLRGVAVRVRPAARRISALVETRHPLQDLTNLLRLTLAELGPGAGSFLLRAAAVEWRGKLILFAGVSHAGKSTLARLSEPRRVHTDDAVLLRAASGGIRAATLGSWGIEGSEALRPRRERLELEVASVLLLRRATEHRLLPLSPSAAALELACAFALAPGDASASRAALGLALDIAASVPVAALEFSNRDAGFWSLLEAGLARP